MNETIFFFFYDLAHKSIFFDQVVIFVAEVFPYIVVVLAGLFLIFPRRFSRDSDLKASGQHFYWKEFFLVFFSGAFAWFLSHIMKFIFHTDRPYIALQNVNSLFLQSDFSFPSGHSTFFMALAFAIFFKHKKVGYFFIVFAILIGLARIIAGVHFPIDILGGFVLGFLIAFFLKKV